MNGDDQGNGKNGSMAKFLYRSALLAICTALMGICSWVLIAVLKNNERSIKMETDIGHFNASVSRIEKGLENRVTKPELELATTRMRNDQLKFENEFLRITQPSMLVPPRNQHTGR